MGPLVSPNLKPHDALGVRQRRDLTQHRIQSVEVVPSALPSDVTRRLEVLCEKERVDVGELDEVGVGGLPRIGVLRDRSHRYLESPDPEQAGNRIESAHPPKEKA